MTLDEFRDLIDHDDRNIIVQTDNAEDCAFVTKKYINEFYVRTEPLTRFCEEVISMHVAEGDKHFLFVASRNKTINFFSIYATLTNDDNFIISFAEFMEMFSGQFSIPDLEEFV